MCIIPQIPNILKIKVNTGTGFEPEFFVLMRWLAHFVSQVTSNTRVIVDASSIPPLDYNK